MGQRRGLQVGVHLLDDRVATMGLVRGHGVGDLVGVVVKNACWRQCSNSAPSWNGAHKLAARNYGDVAGPPPV